MGVKAEGDGGGRGTTSNWSQPRRIRMRWRSLLAMWLTSSTLQHASWPLHVSSRQVMGALLPVDGTATAGRSWVSRSRVVVNARWCYAEAGMQMQVCTHSPMLFKEVKLKHVLSIVQTCSSHRVPRLASALLNVLLLPIMVTQEATGRGCRARPVCMAFCLTNG